MCLLRSGEARLLLGHIVAWETKAVVQAARGLAKAGDRIQEPKPAVSHVIFVKIVSTYPLADEIIRAIWVSWVSLLRAPSECVPLLRQLPNEEMGADSVL